jgi:glycosyltransferase involved in cell wall biosynthesis
MGRENILIVSYDFPPALAGVRRVVKFARYLPEFGYDPIVLAATPDPMQPHDYETLREIRRQGYPVYRTPALDLNHVRGALASIPEKYRFTKETLLSHLNEPPFPGEPIAAEGEATDEDKGKHRGRWGGWLGRRLGSTLRRWLYLPDDRVGWLPFAWPQAVRVLEGRPVRYVMTTSYPNSTHLLGAMLKRRYKVLWVADFRDGWVTNPYFADYPTPLHRRRNEKWEQQVAREADLLLTVSEPIAAHLRELSGQPAKVHVIPNGYDPEDFINLPPLRFDRFTLAYTGTLFGQRSPEPLFAAMRILFDKYPQMRSEFQAVFLTQWQPEHLEMIERYGLSDNITSYGILPYRTALQIQRNADVLVAIEGPAPHGEMMLTQKVFEYLACGRPILAITPENALAALVRSTRAGFVVAPEDVERLVEKLYELFTGTAEFSPKVDMIKKYQRREQTRFLASLLDELRGVRRNTRRRHAAVGGVSSGAE